ncbi:hypothetical protein C4G73_RS21220 [Vibrio parahaemolyticus]|uniref:hypothetical protein n=1 Tax=Vibrio parahaemolyticus TaxID=670 RepID=UPI000A74F5CC|nr:hypothetical protein [Vibrio parahaemolyticus]EJC6733302.1 hypothetical protein [Vibrio parahaemolyticus]EJC6946750.1 hypothetical protein [Vibrio parahaemolyticus]EJC7032703.1 hypothetical protein [Vibrio parahaemolyticus]EJC7071637.1 hypothetical protein [Vibrio parahaemolyticus]EJG0591504.1 hypothetical protein [Vibrio parahaemolyticus]
MIEHLKQILAVTEEGRHAVVVMDGAGWHTEEIANDFKMSVSSNFRPILQSEQVWRWLRQRDLSNQSFTDYHDIISKLYDA